MNHDHGRWRESRIEIIIRIDVHLEFDHGSMTEVIQGSGIDDKSPVQMASIQGPIVLENGVACVVT